MSYTPQRVQYPFDMPDLKYKSRSDIFRLQTQWNTFERIENYDDVIYQRVQDGLRDQTFYSFRDSGELNDYRNGQDLHIQRYTNTSHSSTSPKLAVDQNGVQIYVGDTVEATYNAGTIYFIATITKITLLSGVYVFDLSYANGRNASLVPSNAIRLPSFTSIRDRPFPETPAKTTLPYISQVMKNVVSAPPIPAEEYTTMKADAEIYTYVSTYNQLHVYKYLFTSDEERLAYSRAERRILSPI